MLLSCVSLALSLLFLPSLCFRWFSAFPTSDGSTFFHPRLLLRILMTTPSTMWNPLLELHFFEHVNCIVGSHLVDLDLVKIALSCHFAFALLCYKEEVLVSAHVHWAPLDLDLLVRMAPLPPL